MNLGGKTSPARRGNVYRRDLSTQLDRRVAPLLPVLVLSAAPARWRRLHGALRGNAPAEGGNWTSSGPVQGEGVPPQDTLSCASAKEAGAQTLTPGSRADGLESTVSRPCADRAQTIGLGPMRNGAIRSPWDLRAGLSRRSACNRRSWSRRGLSSSTAQAKCGREPANGSFVVEQHDVVGRRIDIEPDDVTPPFDELGSAPLPMTGARLLFAVFSQRYERGSTIVTSRRRTQLERHSQPRA